MTQKEFFFFFYFFRVFFFKVITEQVVVDANLPSVSKESVGQVRAGGEGGRAGCLEALTARVCLFSFEGIGAGAGTGVKLQKMNRKRKVVGDEGKGHPPKSSALPRKAEGRDGSVESSRRKSGGFQPLLRNPAAPPFAWVGRVRPEPLGARFPEPRPVLARG